MSEMHWLVAKALRVATDAHEGQLRKHTGDPYIIHPIAVAQIIARHRGSFELQAAALLHYVVEDTSVSKADLERVFPPEVVAAVGYMTERHVDGNRKARKAAECARLAAGPPDHQSLKLADLIHNTGSIVDHDPKFAAVYLVEKRALLDALTDAWPSIRAEAEATLSAGLELLSK